MKNGTKGLHYPYRLYRNGRAMRNKYFDIIRAAGRATQIALMDKRGYYELIARPSQRIVFAVQRGRTRVSVLFNSRIYVKR